MAAIKIKFNGSELTGITLDLSGLAAIMTPAPIKTGVSYSSRIANGSKFLQKAGEYKLDSRSFTLTLNCCGNTEQEFLNNYKGLCNILKQGRFIIKTNVTPRMEVIYNSCTTFTQYDRGIGKFSLKLTEIDPSYTPTSDTPQTSEQ